MGYALDQGILPSARVFAVEAKTRIRKTNVLQSADAADVIVVGMCADQVLDFRRSADRQNVFNDRVARVLKSGIDDEYPPVGAGPISHGNRVAAVGAPNRQDGNQFRTAWPAPITPSLRRRLRGPKPTSPVRAGARLGSRPLGRHYAPDSARAKHFDDRDVKANAARSQVSQLAPKKAPQSKNAYFFDSIGQKLPWGKPGKEHAPSCSLRFGPRYVLSSVTS
jgi:hypothetical protein